MRKRRAAPSFLPLPWGPGRAAAGPGAISRGFTLLELLLVLAIIAIASAGVLVAMRTPEQTQLAREADRLAAVLESARAQSRGSGLPVVWHADASGFRFEGLLNNTSVGDTPPADSESPGLTPWLTSGVVVAEGVVLSLGPEPIIGRQAVVLMLGNSSIRIATDGLRPFLVEPDVAVAAGGGGS